MLERMNTLNFVIIDVKILQLTVPRCYAEKDWRPMYSPEVERGIRGVLVGKLFYDLVKIIKSLNYP